jgi:hypothetical protein
MDVTEAVRRRWRLDEAAHLGAVVDRDDGARRGGCADQEQHPYA